MTVYFDKKSLNFLNQCGYVDGRNFTVIPNKGFSNFVNFAVQEALTKGNTKTSIYEGYYKYEIQKERDLIHLSEEKIAFCVSNIRKLREEQNKKIEGEIGANRGK